MASLSRPYPGQPENQTIYTYEYNAAGQRTSKTKTYSTTGESITTEFIYEGDLLVGQKTSDGKGDMTFLHDDTGAYIGLIYEGVEYYYMKNVQGDIIGIVDAEGVIQAVYTYEPFGKLFSIETKSGFLRYDGDWSVGGMNPIRYRGYYYDYDTKLYYLNSRYYDPYVGRFLNADNQIAGGNDMTGMNLFAYSGNNPINFSDPSGMWKQVSGGWQAQKGDTLWGLAVHLYGNGSMWTLLGFNRDPKSLQIGEIIKTGNKSSVLRDVTNEVNSALKVYALLARDIRRLAIAIPMYDMYRYGVFGLLVNHGGPWDIKRRESWKSTIGTAYPGAYNTPIVYGGKVMTPESLGNFAYGYLGAAFGFSYQTLTNGSVGATFITGGLGTKSGVANEVGDWNYIAMGYLNYIF